MSMDIDVEICDRCAHPWFPHVLVATMHSAIHGGLLFCKEPGCLCLSSWSIDGEPRPYLPDAAEVARLREWVQSDSEFCSTPEDEWPLEDGIGINIE